MSIYGRIGSYELTHMLGYLEPKEWADALCNEDNYKKDIVKLIVEQEQTYGYDLMIDVLDKVGSHPYAREGTYVETLKNVYREVIDELKAEGYTIKGRL